MNYFRSKRLGTLLLILTVAAGLLLAGCESDPLTEETRTVELGEAVSVLVDITMAAGSLEISDGATALMEADFVYNVDEWTPQVNYEVQGQEGILTVRQPAGLDINLGDNRYEWDLEFNGDVPLMIRSKLGAGDSVLDLKGLTLSGLDINIGAGDVDLDLSGAWESGFDGRVRGGVGSVQVLLPSDVGVEVEVTGGLGQVTAVNLRREGNKYFNAAYDESPVTIRLDIEGGVGQVDLEVIE